MPSLMRIIYYCSNKSLRDFTKTIGKINVEKCVFGNPEVLYLDFTLNPGAKFGRFLPFL